VATPDFTLQARRMLPLGAAGMLAVRPDDFAIVPAGTANAFPVRVDLVEYAGRESLADVITPSGVKLIVRTAVALATGEDVHLHVPPERALVYPAE
jgi:hypothetical protein